jgi:hypothetical protein
MFVFRPKTKAVLTLVIVSCFQTEIVAGSQSAPFPPQRPEMVKKALERNQDLYYFGIGSNMLRSKLENRSICGTKIQLKSMEPAFVENYRLAFNLKGFPPLEPGMGSLEPVDDHAPTKSKPLAAYEKNQCHGALVRVSAADYEKIMRSEGVGNGSPDQAYEEVVVQALPYGRSRPVLAIALQARDHVRLNYDPAPSRRYLEILRKGADELGLEPNYRNFLEAHPVATVSPLTRKLAVCNLVWTITMSFRLKFRMPSRIQNKLMWKVYVPPTAHTLSRFLSELATIVILLPGAIPGSCMLMYHKFAKKEFSRMMKSMVDSHW